MRYFAMTLLVIALPATALQAHSMPVSTFLAKANALKAKGAMALFSSDIGLLKKEIQNSAKALRAEQLADQKAGRKSTLCLPAKAAVNSNELLAHFNSIPAAQRNMSVKAGFAGLMRKKFPCPA